ncbi:MAG: hypothetical protein WDO68_30000 [Gammaproteobacteria bacterium]
MNRAILTLLLDYHRRTLGVWVLVVFVQLMQMSALWVLGSRNVPVVGAVIASLAFSATWDSPHFVMRTLPIKARELALLRWWERIAMPMLFITLAFVLAWFSNTGSRFPTPPFAGLWIPVSASFATLAFLSVLPLPTLSALRSNVRVFGVVWIAMVIAGLRGVPMEWLPEPLPTVLLICGSILALVSLGLARSGRVLQMPSPSRLFAGFGSQGREASFSRSRFRGWPVLVMQWMRTTFLLALASIVVISIVRPHVHLLQQTLPWIFVSITGAVGTILSRRWLRSTPALQCLPIRTSMLALVVCLALMTPVVVTSVAATAVNAIVPEWGIAIPLYMVPVFAIVPALEMSWHNVQTSHPVASSVQQWSPIMQVVAWPLWTGSFMSLELTRLMPAWFGITAVGLAVVLAGIAYFVVLFRIRAGIGLERIGDPLTPR